jgi:hypothetical protein
MHGCALVISIDLGVAIVNGLIGAGDKCAFDGVPSLLGLRRPSALPRWNPPPAGAPKREMLSTSHSWRLPLASFLYSNLLRAACERPASWRPFGDRPDPIDASNHNGRRDIDAPNAATPRACAPPQRQALLLLLPPDRPRRDLGGTMTGSDRARWSRALRAKMSGSSYVASTRAVVREFSSMGTQAQTCYCLDTP